MKKNYSRQELVLKDELGSITDMEKEELKNILFKLDEIDRAILKYSLEENFNYVYKFKENVWK